VGLKEFHYDKIENLVLDMKIVNLLTKIHEYKGKQELYIKGNLPVLEKLMDLAIIQSTDASNAIEGIFTSSKRLKEIIQEKAKPKSRDEQEIAGYRDVLSTIHESYKYIDITPNNILQLHKNLHSYSDKSYGGHFKNIDNVITEKDPDGSEFVCFIPAPAMLTPRLVEELCNEYSQEIKKGHIDPIVLIPCFIMDFLSIHPFNDGNGRMSRLLTLLLLYRSGYNVGKYISLEMIIERTKESYYEALHDSSIGWTENQNTYVPFLKYILGVILKAYRDFEERFVIVNEKVSAPERVLEVLRKSLTPLAKADIVILVPEYSQKTIERALSALKNDGKIGMIGAGRKTTYFLNKIDK
jgi:Fic family protein